MDPAAPTWPATSVVEQTDSMATLEPDVSQDLSSFPVPPPLAAGPLVAQHAANGIPMEESTAPSEAEEGLEPQHRSEEAIEAPEAIAEEPEGEGHKKRPRVLASFDAQWAPIQQGLEQIMAHTDVAPIPHNFLLNLYTKVYNLSTRHDSNPERLTPWDAETDSRALLYSHLRSAVQDFHLVQQSTLVARVAEADRQRHRSTRLFLMLANRRGIPLEVVTMIFNAPNNPGFLEPSSESEVLTELLPSLWARHRTLIRPLCFVFRYMDHHYVRDFSLPSIRECLSRSFTEEIIAPHRKALFLLLAYPSLMRVEPSEVAQNVRTLRLPKGGTVPDSSHGRAVLALAELAAQDPAVFPVELMEFLTVGYFEYYSASDICPVAAEEAGASAPARSRRSIGHQMLYSWPPRMTDEGDPEAAAPITLRHLCPAFQAVVVQVTTPLLGADAVAGLLWKLTIHVRLGPSAYGS